MGVTSGERSWEFGKKNQGSHSMAMKHVDHDRMFVESHCSTPGNYKPLPLKNLKALNSSKFEHIHKCLFVGLRLTNESWKVESQHNLNCVVSALQDIFFFESHSGILVIHKPSQLLGLASDMFSPPYTFLIKLIFALYNAGSLLYK